MQVVKRYFNNWKESVYDVFKLLKISVVSDRINSFLFFSLIAMCISVVGVRYFANFIVGRILDALNSKNLEKILLILSVATSFCLISALFDVMKKYQIRLLCAKMRQKLYIYYGKNALENTKCELVCQKLSRELDVFPSQIINLITQILEISLSFFTFLAVLYNLGGWIIISGAILYSVFGLVVTKKLAEPIKKLFYETSNLEGQFRKDLVFESEKTLDEAKVLPDITPLTEKAIEVARKERNLGFFRQVFDDFKTYLVYLIMLSSYLSELITLGELYRISGAFRYVMRGFGFFADNRLNIASISVTIQRIKELESV